MDSVQIQNLNPLEVNVPTLPNHLPLPPQIITLSPPQYFTLPTLIAAVGPRGKGKTYNLMLWNKWMFDNNYFTRFYVISPTYESNDTIRTVPIFPDDVYTHPDECEKALNDIISKIQKDVAWYEEILVDYTDKYKEYINANKCINDMKKDSVIYLRKMQNEIKEFYEKYKIYDEIMEPKSEMVSYTLSFFKKQKIPDRKLESILDERYDECHPFFYKPPKLRRPVPLLFIDDCSHSPIYSRAQNNPLVNLSLRHRHLGGQGYGVTIEFAVQTFKSGLPKALRNNTMQFLIFNTKDTTALNSIYEELGGNCGKETFFALFDQAIQNEDHNFLLVDVNASDPRKRYRRNWDTYLIVNDNMNQNKKRKVDESEKKTKKQKTTLDPTYKKRERDRRNKKLEKIQDLGKVLNL